MSNTIAKTLIMLSPASAIILSAAKAPIIAPPMATILPLRPTPATVYPVSYTHLTLPTIYSV